ncbi:MAG: glycosyltransferase family 2 protein [Chthoniobacterales bacterium]
MFSILILTKNEECNISACLQSVTWCDDVVVLDSFSTDLTCQIAESFNARTYQHSFDDFGSQRNYALDHIPFKYAWVFHLDADERFNNALTMECERVIIEDRCSAFSVPNRIIFLNRWIKYSTQYPYPQVRLLKVGEVRFIKAGHGQKEDHLLRGVGYIAVPYDHYNFSHGLAAWVQKHNHYSTEEAKSIYENEAGTLLWSDLLSRDSLRRRRALKKLHSQMPLRWLVKFFYLYILRGGFLDYYPGLAYCALQGFYDLLICIKLRELRESGCNR